MGTKLTAGASRAIKKMRTKQKLIYAREYLNDALDLSDSELGWTQKKAIQNSLKELREALKSLK